MMISEKNSIVYFSLIILSFFLFISIDCGAAATAENSEEKSAGVLIKGFDFVRENRGPDSETVIALKNRRQQIQDMADSEQGRLEQAQKSTRENIQSHIKFLQASLEEIDRDIARGGDTLVPSSTLHEALYRYRDRVLSLDEMNEAANLVTTAYQERGYILARAYVPEQEIKDGILRIAIIEGDVGEVKVSGQTYYNERVIRRNFLEQVKHGVVKEDLLERGLLLSSELPFSETRVVLEPGEKTGSANIVLKTEDRLALNWTVDFNNFGSELVSKQRYGTYIDITDPWWGSTLSLRGVTGNTMKESLLGKADMSIPISMYGTKLNLSYMKGLYVVGQELADLGMDGDTTTYGMGFSHPFLREKNQNLTVSVGYEHKFSRIFIKDELENVDKLNVLYATLDYDSLDRYLGKNIVSLGVYHGKLFPDEDYPYSRKNADRRFNRINISAARIQKIYGNVNFMVRGLGQLSNNNLLPIEEMGIGGYGTVRGHNLALFMGDTGFTLSGELLTAPPFIADKVVFGQRVSQMMQFSFFYDYGRVYYTEHLRGDLPDERLNGYGLGIRLYYKDFFTFKFDLARPAKRKAKTEDNAYVYFMSSFDLTSQDFFNTLENIKAWWKGSTGKKAPAEP